MSISTPIHQKTKPSIQILTDPSTKTRKKSGLSQVKLFELIIEPSPKHFLSTPINQKTSSLSLHKKIDDLVKIRSSENLSKINYANFLKYLQNSEIGSNKKRVNLRTPVVSTKSAQKISRETILISKPKSPTIFLGSPLPTKAVRKSFTKTFHIRKEVKSPVFPIPPRDNVKICHIRRSSSLDLSSLSLRAWDIYSPSS